MLALSNKEETSTNSALVVQARRGVTYFFVRSLHAVNDDAKNKLQQRIAKQTSWISL